MNLLSHGKSKFKVLSQVKMRFFCLSITPKMGSRRFETHFFGREFQNFVTLDPLVRFSSVIPFWKPQRMSSKMVYFKSWWSMTKMRHGDFSDVFERGVPPILRFLGGYFQNFVTFDPIVRFSSVIPFRKPQRMSSKMVYFKSWWSMTKMRHGDFRHVFERGFPPILEKKGPQNLSLSAQLIFI